jgi:hypothetical protein
VVAAPSGARIRTRIRPTPDEAAVLIRVGAHLGRLASADLAERLRIGDVPTQLNQRAARKNALTVESSSRWAGAITRTSNDQYTLSSEPCAQTSGP